MPSQNIPNGYTYNTPAGYDPADNPTFPHPSSDNSYDQEVGYLFLYLVLWIVSEYFEHCIILIEVKYWSMVFRYLKTDLRKKTK